MKRPRLAAILCCLGAALSALLPCAVLWWGESLVEKPFPLPAIAYPLPENPAAEGKSPDLEQTIRLLEKGSRGIVTTMDAAEVDAFILMDGLREEIGDLQNRGVLPAGAVYFFQSAVLTRWSLPEGSQANLWEFTILTEGETALLRYHPDSGRILSLERTLSEEAPPSLLAEAREGYGGYLADRSVPGSAQVRAEGRTLSLSILPP